MATQSAATKQNNMKRNEVLYMTAFFILANQLPVSCEDDAVFLQMQVNFSPRPTTACRIAIHVSSDEKSKDLNPKSSRKAALEWAGKDGKICCQ
jgi:hypothetical protein